MYALLYLSIKYQNYVGQNDHQHLFQDSLPLMGSIILRLATIKYTGNNIFFKNQGHCVQ